MNKVFNKCLFRKGKDCNLALLWLFSCLLFAELCFTEGCSTQPQSGSSEKKEDRILLPSPVTTSVSPLSYCEQQRASKSSSHLFVDSGSGSRPEAWKGIKRIVLVVLENTDFEEAIEQPFLRSLASRGALLTQSYGVTHPSEPNYLALTSATLGHPPYGSGSQNLDVQHLGDLLGRKSLRWKVYAEGYPGGCFLGVSLGKYVLRHVPFLSFQNITQSNERCSQIVPASDFDGDIEKHAMADFSLYIPDLHNDGHDTGVGFADSWLKEKFQDRLLLPSFISETLFIVTFDESLTDKSNNRILTVLYGAGITPGSESSTCYDHFSLLATIESIFNIGSLGKRDHTASVIQGIWSN